MIGYLATLCIVISQIPQAKIKDVSNLSIWTYLLLLIACILWCIHGYIIMDIPILLTNSISLLPISYILIKKFRYEYFSKIRR